VEIGIVSCSHAASPSWRRRLPLCCSCGGAGGAVVQASRALRARARQGRELA